MDFWVPEGFYKPLEGFTGCAFLRVAFNQTNDCCRQDRDAHG